jgi:pyruvate/2-oxoglutarate dehydrogenase complex dihydrolipoamide dehydrogenase (E3) component
VLRLPPGQASPRCWEHSSPHIEALELDRLPPHLIVLGGGYVGLELAQAYRRFASRVTVLEHGSQLAGREDPDVADALGQFLGDEAI